MALACQHLEEGRSFLYPIFQGKDSQLILRQIRERCAQEIERNLRAAFSEADSNNPFELLANYLAGAQIALIQWWLEKRRPYAPDSLTRTLHGLQRAVILGAFKINAEDTYRTH